MSAIRKCATAVCDGQTGYTAHFLDEKVEHVICRLLEQLGAVEESFLLQGYLLCEEKQLRRKIRDAAHEVERKKPSLCGADGED